MSADGTRSEWTRVAAPLKGLAAAGVLAILLAGCKPGGLDYGAKHMQPLSYAIKSEMAEKNMSARDPVMVRLFKEESELEVWKRTKSGKYALLKSYEICKWSGKLGPKFKEGDRQAPEGFYTIGQAQMNPNSSYYLSFNLGFPNAYDRANERTGTFLMVHGSCSSAGCYAMTDEQIQEIYSLARESFIGGQRDFQVQAYPFRMSAENMARHADNEHMPFWRMLKRGYDHFEVTRQVPKVDVCGKQYIFDAKPEDGGRFIANKACPAYQVPSSIKIAVAAKQRLDNEKTAVLIAELAEKRAREERWKSGDTAFAKIFGGGAAGQDNTVAASVDGESGASVPVAGDEVSETSALAYAGTPVPAPNPSRLYEAKPSGGLFSGLFKRETPPAPPEADVPQAVATPLVVAPPAGTLAEDELLTTQSIGSQPEKKRNLKAVSDLVSRWFGGSKPAN